MAHNTYRIFFHAVFSTKYRLAILDKTSLATMEETVHALTKELEFGCPAFGGHVDHVHLLLSLPPHKNIAAIIKRIKGRTSRENANIYWQKGYYVETVSPGAVGSVKDYIDNQWTRHEMQQLENTGYFEPKSPESFPPLPPN